MDHIDTSFFWFVLLMPTGVLSMFIGWKRLLCKDGTLDNKLADTVLFILGIMAMFIAVRMLG